VPGPAKRYEILDRIGIGGMAEVFRARAIFEGDGPTTVVVKRILPHLSENPDFQSMFMDEARIAAALQHPNIVRLLDLGRIDGQLFIALEFVDGQDLERIVKTATQRTIRLPIDAAIFVTLEVLKGLHHAHTRRGADGAMMGIVHRDLSPANVLVSHEGDVKIADFGVAKAAIRAKQTVAGVIKGNAKCMAPEQIYGSEMDARTDVYGTGLLLLTMLSGRSPFDDDPLPRILDRVLKGDIPLPSAFNPDVPPALDLLVEKATKILPRMRFASALAFHDALDAFSKEYGLHPRRTSVARALAEIGAPELAASAGGMARSPSIVSRLGPLIADSVASSGGSIFTTLGKIRIPAPTPASEAVDPDEVATDTSNIPAPLGAKGRTGTELVKIPSKARTAKAAAAASKKPRALTEGPGRLLGHRQAVSALAVSPNGLTALSASHDHTVVVWDLVGRTEIRRLSGHKSAITSIALAPDGVHVVTGSRDKTVKVWDAAAGELVATLAGHTGWVFSVAVSLDGRHAASGSFDRTIRLWDLDTEKSIRTLEGHKDSVSAVAFAPEGEWLLSGSFDKSIKTWDMRTGKVRRSFSGEMDSVRAAVLSPDGSCALAAGADSVLRLWDLTWGSEIQVFEGHREPVVSVAFSPDGKFALSGSYDGEVKLWSIAEKLCLKTFEGPREPVLSVAFGPSGKFALSGSADGAVTIWETA
jgi:WD40 repeat protein